MPKTSLRPAVRAGCSALEAAPSSTTLCFSQQRCFTASTLRQAGHVFAFPKVSNEPLSQILDEIHRKIILPSYLRPDERKKLSRLRYEAALKKRPIQMEIDKKEYKFQVINFKKGEMPNSREIFFRALKNMQTPSDWNVLPKLLEGVGVLANRKFEPRDFPRMTRLAVFGGNLGSVIECAAIPGKTGFRLDTSEKVQEILSGVVWRASEADWSGPASRAALASAERVLQLVAEDAHNPRRPPKPRTQVDGLALDPRRVGDFRLADDPQFLATPLLCAAVLALKHDDRQAADRVRQYARALVAAWPADRGLLQLHPDMAYIEPECVQYLMDKGKFLWVAAPIVKALGLAAEVVDGGDLAKKLRALRDKVREETKSALKDVKDGRGRTLHDRLANMKLTNPGAKASNGKAKPKKDPGTGGGGD